MCATLGGVQKWSWSLLAQVAFLCHQWFGCKPSGPLFFLSFSIHCFSPPLAGPRMLIFGVPLYFDPTRRNIFFKPFLIFAGVSFAFYSQLSVVAACLTPSPCSILLSSSVFTYIGVPRKLIFGMPPYFDPTGRNGVFSVFFRHCSVATTWTNPNPGVLTHTFPFFPCIALNPLWEYPRSWSLVSTHILLIFNTCSRILVLRCNFLYKFLWTMFGRGRLYQPFGSLMFLFKYFGMHFSFKLCERKICKK